MTLQQEWKKYDEIRLAGIVRESIVDGPGLRFTIFCQGCPHDCPGCHNQETHDFSGGYDCDMQKILDAIDADPLLDGVTFSGGEPFCQAGPFACIAEAARERGLNVMAYSGYTYEELLALNDPEVDRLLSLLDWLVDGRFVQEQRDLTLLFRGSKNQRVIDMKATREEGKIVLDARYI